MRSRAIAVALTVLAGLFVCIYCRKSPKEIDAKLSVEKVDSSPLVMAGEGPLVVTAEIATSGAPLDRSSVRLHCRLMFEPEKTLVMNDEGRGCDRQANDGVFTAQIPSIAKPGEMLRWYVSAQDLAGRVAREPKFQDPDDSAEYFGTVVPDPEASDDLPVMYWFVQDEAAAATQAGTRASLYYLGEFYDNIQVDLHGQSTAGDDFPKKSFDFDSNKGQKFKIAKGLKRHSDFNLLTNYADQTKLRNTIAYAAFAKAGAAHHLAFPISVHRNGNFYGLYDFVEEGESEHLKRVGLDPKGALYKVNNNLEGRSAAYLDVKKKTRKNEGHSDLEAFIQGVQLSPSEAARWDYDQLDIPSWVNYLAVQSLLGNIDFGHKNQYLYRDTNKTQRWQILPWDLDLCLGHRWKEGTEAPYFDASLATEFSEEELFNGRNPLIKRLFQEPNFRAMYLRRLRTLSDQILGAPGTSVTESWAYQQFEQWGQRIAVETQRDQARWGRHANFCQTPAEAIAQIQNDYLLARRRFIANQAEVPSPQQAVLDVRFESLPETDRPLKVSEQYLVLANHEETAVDISGWTIHGSVKHEIKPGTVIPAGKRLYLVMNVPGFQSRTSGPRGGMALMTQRVDRGAFSPLGGRLLLSDGGEASHSILAYRATVQPTKQHQGRINIARSSSTITR